ncbi:MAG: hypothetical protein WD055_02350 [Candidatus Dependentiae bacterium]
MQQVIVYTKKVFVLSLLSVSAVHAAHLSRVSRLVPAMQKSLLAPGLRSQLALNAQQSLLMPGSSVSLRSYSEKNKPQVSVSTHSRFLPKLSWSVLSNESKQNVIKSTSLAAFAGSGCTSLGAAVFPEATMGWLMAAALVGSISAIKYGRSAYRQIPESEILNLYKKYYALHLEFQSILKNSYFQVVTRKPDLDQLINEVEKIGLNEHCPLVMAFEHWKTFKKRLESMDEDISDIHEKHEALSAKVHSSLIVPLKIELFDDIPSLQNKLEVAMNSIKHKPNWADRVSAYNVQLTREAAERTEQEAKRARLAAKKAASDASFASIMSIIAVINSFSRR